MYECVYLRKYLFYGTQNIIKIATQHTAKNVPRQNQ